MKRAAPDPAVPRKVRLRPDNTARSLRNKDTECSVVKCTFNKFCKAEGAALRDALNSIVLEVNQTVAEAYLLANLHITRLIDGGLPVPELTLSFFYGCLASVSQAGKKKPDSKDAAFRASVDMYRGWAAECPEHQAPDSRYLSSGFHQQTSTQMLVNTRVYIAETFARRFKKYIQHRHGLNGSEARRLMTCIFAAEYAGDEALVLDYRSHLPRKPEYGRLEDQPHLVLPMLHEILRYFEAQHRVHAQAETVPGKALRLFSLLPNKRGFECSHVKLCNNGLYGLLKRSGAKMELPADGPAWRAAAPNFWRMCFRIEHFETANRHFAGEVLTDGHAVSIVMRKPKRKNAGGAARIDLDDFDRVIGLDPGRTDMLTTCDTRGAYHHHSTRRYHHDATYKASLRTIQGWNDGDAAIRRVHEELPTRKSSHVEVLKAHAIFVLPVLRATLQWHMRKPFRKLKLRRYIAGWRALQKVCDDLTGGQRTLVGFGDWSNRDVAGVIKKSPAGPVKRLERELRKRPECRVVEVDEFRTSKLHSACGCAMRHAYRHKHERRCPERGFEGGELRGVVKVHAVLSCPNSCCRGICMNRDENAALNILQLLRMQVTGHQRPPHFSRGVELREDMRAPFGDVSVSPVHSGNIA